MTLSTTQIELLKSFRLTNNQKHEVIKAWAKNPNATERCALRAQAEGKRTGTTGAGLLLTMLRRGDHQTAYEPNTRRITGWRWVRSEQSGTYVPDPHGTDPLPPGYGLDDPTKVFGERLPAVSLKHLTSDRRDEPNR